MPHSPSEAKPAQKAAPWLGFPLRAPGRFALCAMAAYALLCLPILATHRFDPSVFVSAGDRYVTASQTHPRLLVKTQSDGYDGQFYYRMAVVPFSVRPVEDGITFDHPAKRLQRVLYPLLAFLAASGQPAFTAWSMLLVNLGGIFAIAAGAAMLSRRLALSGAAAYAILLWPGLIVTLTHDTTEIVSLACMIWALVAYLAGRLAPYAALAACATLARETSLPVFAALFAWDAWRARDAGAIKRCAASALALLPFPVWHVLLGRMAHEDPQAQPLAQDIGPPFLGVAHMLWACVTGARAWASTPLKDAIIRAIVLLTAPVILLVCARVATTLPAAFKRPNLAPIAAAWLAIACLMSLLTASGPWIDPIAYFRAFTDCFALGCLLLSPSARTVAWLGACELALVWTLCLLKLR
jgi:hypothetical protein